VLTLSRDPRRQKFPFSVFFRYDIFFPETGSELFTAQSKLREKPDQFGPSSWAVIVRERMALGHNLSSELGYFKLCECLTAVPKTN
jgi:hypothetical protein